MAKSKAEISLTPCDLVVLATIAAEPCHGYDLWKKLEAADVNDWAPVSKPQIYYSLKKLENLRLIAPRRAAGKPAGPKKEVFAATKPGREALRKNLARPFWAETREPPPFTTWAALSLNLPAKDKRAQIERRRVFLQKEMAREKATLKDLQQYDVESASLARSLVGLVIEFFKTELKWLDQFEQSIKPER